MPTKQLRVGIVGVGFVGAAHVDAVRRIPGAEVVAVASSTPDRARRHADELGIPRAYADYRGLLADPEIDVVHNCTPNVWHFPINQAIVEAGKACFSEKPLTMNAAEAEQLLRLARSRGAHTAVNFNHRGFPQVQEARALIQQGELGRVHAVHGSYLQDWLLFDTDWNWRLDPTLGGATRVVADIGSHWMDLAQHIAGVRITAVMADLATLFVSRVRPDREGETFQRGSSGGTRVPIETEDYAQVLVRFENGARGSFTVSQVSAGRKNRLSLEVDGGQGALAWCSEEGELLWRGSRTEGTRVLQRNPRMAGLPGLSRLPAGHAEGWNDALLNVIRGFYEQVQGAAARPWVASLDDGVHGMRLVDAILQSSREERWVTVV
ncbi:MAG: Gfo/Idh/MocA family oxidoreductase [Chloroflexi bacterium]|nr:Gfo/Idh/MocA family oxidoreductase [Chloroflexota bacterium]